MKSKTRILKELENMIKAHQGVLDDPMNGCPEDFAEDFAPIEQRKIAEAYKAGATDEEIEKAMAEGSRKASEEHEKIFGKEY